MKIDVETQRRLACLGDASRYRLVMALASGPRCVTELAEAVGLSQSCTTRHLQALQAAGLVRRIRDGKRVMIRLNRDEPQAGPMLEWVLEQVGPGTIQPGRRANGNGRVGRPIRPSRSRGTRGGPESASGVENGNEPRRAQALSTAAEPHRAAGGEELRKTEAGTRADSAPGGVHADEEAASENGEAEHLGPIRRPDTIEDYLL
jgi:DNA-binding transcriptional ArsR family regulator